MQVERNERTNTLRWVVFGGLAFLAASAWGQQPSTKNGEWPYYTADLKGTQYSPLDQINASNFNKLEVAWRFKTDNLGHASGIQAGRHAARGQWRDLHHRRHAPRRWSRWTPRPAS